MDEIFWQPPAEPTPAKKEKKRWPLVLLFTILGLAVGVFIGLSFVTNGQMVLLQQAKDMREIGELAWYIESFAYDEPDQDTLYTGASKGMVAALDDRYAAYYTAEEFDEMMTMQSGEYVGIGIAVSLQEETGDIFIEEVYEGSPAELAGLKKGDQILKVDLDAVGGEDGMDMEELLVKIQEKGEAGFLMSVMGKDGTTSEVTLKNEAIVVNRVHFSMEDDIAVIRLDEFTGNAREGMQEAIQKAEEAGAQGIVIDLRDNPGGDLQVVIGIADDLLDSGVVMTMKSRDGQEEVYRSEQGKITDLPLAVLINGNSASASEVLAGALQDYGAAGIIGTKSFGKGIVQSIYPLQMSDGHVKLTTAKYYTPKGRSIHGTGIEPDIEVELPEEYDETRASSVPFDEDTQLQEAIAYLEKSDEEREKLAIEQESEEATGLLDMVKKGKMREKQ